MNVPQADDFSGRNAAAGELVAPEFCIELDVLDELSIGHVLPSMKLYMISWHRWDLENSSGRVESSAVGYDTKISASRHCRGIAYLSYKYGVRVNQLL